MTTLLLLISLSFAGTREEGELSRLVDEMIVLSERQAWTGVERTYAKVLDLEDVAIPRDVHISAAHAARSTGDMAEVVVRLRRAQTIERTDEEANWLNSIDEEFARVELRTVPARSVDLVPALMPFEPDQRLAVERAIVALSDDGEFVGMLPVGSYVLGTTDFDVTAGYTAHIELSGKELKAAQKKK